MTQTTLRPALRAAITTRCAWCGKHVDIPADPWGIRTYDPVFCCGACLTHYRQEMERELR